MRHRVFIAINLPEDIKKKLADYESNWPELPARWTKKDNLHLTLAFLGYLTDEELLAAIEGVKKAASKHDPFFINLRSIIYGPKGKPPHMVWAEGEKSEELDNLQKSLENSLGLPPRKDRSYAPHITLARLKQWEFQKIEPAERPEISEKIDLNFEASSIEVMESELKKGGPEYIILESSSLEINL